MEVCPELIFNSCNPNPIIAPKNKKMANFLSFNASLKNLIIYIAKKSETENEEMVHEEVAFVPMLPGVSNGDV